MTSIGTAAHMPGFGATLMLKMHHLRSVAAVFHQVPTDEPDSRSCRRFGDVSRRWTSRAVTNWISAGPGFQGLWQAVGPCHDAGTNTFDCLRALVTSNKRRTRS